MTAKSCYSNRMLNPIELGRRIRTRREQLKLSQTQLANSLHITPQAVSKWELGHSSPDISTLMALATWLRISIDDLVGTTPLHSSTIQATVLTTSIRGFATLAASLTPHHVTLTLNGIFSTLTDGILCYQGVPVKYVGDGFLSYFTGPGHENRAIEAGLTIQRLPIDNTIVAIVSGAIYVGTVGHPDYAQLDIMGDTVNRAFLLNQWVSNAGYRLGTMVQDPHPTLNELAIDIAGELSRVYVNKG